VTQGRARFAGVTEVDAAWLADAAPPLAALSAPLDAPAPRYVPRADAVLAWHAAAFGRHGWELPPVARPVGDAAGRARGFAAALLAGAVLPAYAGAWRGARVGSRMQGRRRMGHGRVTAKGCTPHMSGSRRLQHALCCGHGGAPVGVHTDVAAQHGQPSRPA